jgi:hypothetical protein
MTRLTVLLACLAVGTTALAQGAPPPPAPMEPPPPVMVAPEPVPAPTTAPAPLAAPASATPHLKLQEPELKAPTRFSRFSRGPGGPLLVFTGLLTGVATGITFNQGLGGSAQDNFAAGVLGAVLVGGAAAMFQYYAYTSIYGTMLDALAAISGYAFGFGIDLVTSTRGNSALLIPAVAANLALVASSLAHLNVDVSGDDALVVASGAAFATWFAILGTGLVAATNQHTDGSAILLAPALGMALGGGVAALTHVPAARMFKLLLLPIGVGASLLEVGILAGSSGRPLTWAIAGAGTVGTFALTALLTADDETRPGAAPTPAPAASKFRMVPGLTLVKAAHDSFKPALALSGQF